jgi:hypothetical protein
MAANPVAATRFILRIFWRMVAAALDRVGWIRTAMASFLWGGEKKLFE